MATTFVWDNSTGNAWQTNHWLVNGGLPASSPKYPGDTGSTANDVIQIIGANCPTGVSGGSVSCLNFTCQGNTYNSVGAPDPVQCSGTIIFGTPGGTENPQWAGTGGDNSLGYFYAHSTVAGNVGTSFFFDEASDDGAQYLNAVYLYGTGFNDSLTPQYAEGCILYIASSTATYVIVNGIAVTVQAAGFPQSIGPWPVTAKSVGPYPITPTSLGPYPVIT